MCLLAHAKRMARQYLAQRGESGPTVAQVLKWSSEGAYNRGSDTCLPRTDYLSSTLSGRAELELHYAWQDLSNDLRQQFHRWLSNLRPNRDPAREKARKMQYT